MTESVCFIQIGDLHMDDANGWRSLPPLEAIVAEINDRCADTVDFVFLPGDNANHATPEQYGAIGRALAALKLPWRVIPGDHDYESGDLAAYEAAFPPACRPEVEVIGGHRCIFLDIVSAGSGGPDFRLTMHHRNRLARELARAAAERQPPLVFMHAYPGDLASDCDEVARMLADGDVAFVATGHTHYNEILNDGRVVYGATRSTGEIEEGAGEPGYAFIGVHDGVPSWRFKTLGSAWPFVQIVSPCDVRLVTRPGDPRQVPRPGAIAVSARVHGPHAGDPAIVIGGQGPVPMSQTSRGLWTAAVDIREPGLHSIAVQCGASRDAVDVLVRPADDVPQRRPPVALGHACHAIGAWPQAGIDGARLGPNFNGKRW